MGITDRQTPAATATGPTGGYCWLNYYSAIRVTGRDAGEFLNRQLTCDLALVTVKQTGFGAWCTNKGRVSTLLRVVKRPDALYLLFPRDLQEATLQRLRMFVMRDDVVFAPDSDNPLAIVGLIGTEALADLEESCGRSMPTETYQTVHANELSFIRWPGEDSPRVLVLGTQATLQRSLLSSAGKIPQCAFEHWQLQDIRAGIPEITPATRESFIPQMINLERIGGVSFTKGCYPGQEIVARTQHLGRIKRRMFIGHIENCSELAEAGAYLVGENSENLASIVNCVGNSAGGGELLAVTALNKATQTQYLETPAGDRVAVQLEAPGYGFEDPAEQ